MDPLMDNYMALAYAILTGVNTDKTLLEFNLIDVKIRQLQKRQTEDMQRLRDNYSMTYKQIGDLFGLKESSVHHRLRRYKNKS